MHKRVGLNLLLAILATGLAYLLFLGHRTDYLGHYLAGLGATLGLLALFLLVTGRELGWNALAITLVAIGLGFITESSIFRLALFDPVDFCNQSLGACVACSCMLGTRRDRRLIVLAGGLSPILVIVGFLFAFA